MLDLNIFKYVTENEKQISYIWRDKLYIKKEWKKLNSDVELKSEVSISTPVMSTLAHT